MLMKRNLSALLCGGWECNVRKAHATVCAMRTIWLGTKPCASLLHYIKIELIPCSFPMMFFHAVSDFLAQGLLLLRCQAVVEITEGVDHRLRFFAH